jgi:predicted RNase H-like nuclease (RuvC/YqgF family)
MGVNYEEVEAVCENIRAKGGQVTNASVREALGGGSFSDIAPHVKAWKERIKASRTDNTFSNTVDIPQELQHRGQEMIQYLWELACNQENNERINILELENAKLRKEKEGVQAGLQMFMDAYQKEVINYRSQIKHLERQVEEVQIVCDSYRTKCEELQRDIDYLEQEPTD